MRTAAHDLRQTSLAMAVTVRRQRQRLYPTLTVAAMGESALRWLERRGRGGNRVLRPIPERGIWGSAADRKDCVLPYYDGASKVLKPLTATAAGCPGCPGPHDEQALAQELLKAADDGWLSGWVASVIKEARGSTRGRAVSDLEHRRPSCK